MFEFFRQWRKGRILANSPFSTSDWQQAAARLPVLDRLSSRQRLSLYELATLFLHAKRFSGAGGLVLSDSMRQSISLQACLPILNLGLDWYDGWSDIIVYPDAFTRESSIVDEFGVTHSGSRHLSGEAWLRGPVVLSWRDAEQAGHVDGHNVVIHEFVHKLDMMNGLANGFPPLQRDMSPGNWSQLMNEAFEDFQLHPKQGLDRYGATDPAEFFAVLSEVFFETPDNLIAAYPELYSLMTQFYLQDTAGHRQ
ncbi:M90 family metallopeptidase [Granulosicoccus sp. 3-233]|uniref:M90 family metallopeptidase n=1 Tax=Granulosicoccus sp. 3-233 TaxID=3417969 RepID=UPI003D3557AA